MVYYYRGQDKPYYYKTGENRMKKTIRKMKRRDRITLIMLSCMMAASTVLFIYGQNGQVRSADTVQEQIYEI